MTTPKQPGWYDDPKDANAQRYWDGQDWTPHRQRKAISYSPPRSAAPMSPPPPPPSPSAAPTQQAPFRIAATIAAAPARWRRRPMQATTRPAFAPTPPAPPPPAAVPTQPAPAPRLPPPPSPPMRRRRSYGQPPSSAPPAQPPWPPAFVRAAAASLGLRPRRRRRRMGSTFVRAAAAPGTFVRAAAAVRRAAAAAAVSYPPPPPGSGASSGLRCLILRRSRTSFADTCSRLDLSTGDCSSPLSRCSCRGSRSTPKTPSGLATCGQQDYTPFGGIFKLLGLLMIAGAMALAWAVLSESQIRTGLLIGLSAVTGLPIRGFLLGLINYFGGASQKRAKAMRDRNMSMSPWTLGCSCTSLQSQPRGGSTSDLDATIKVGRTGLISNAPAGDAEFRA